MARTLADRVPHPLLKTLPEFKLLFPRSPSKTLGRTRNELQISNMSLWRITQTTIVNETVSSTVSTAGTSLMRLSHKVESGDLSRHHWPPRLPGDFFLWGFVKGWSVFIPPTPQNVQELKTVISNMIERVRQELEYRLDIVRATRGGHTEQL